jgi:hypothetical protein
MIDLSDWKPIISDDAFAYLAVQRGKESDLLYDRSAWKAAYRENLIRLYRNIAPHLPESGWSGLDVGAGLGGIDILIGMHYGRSFAVGILDGINEQPVVEKHDRPFSRYEIAQIFLVENGLGSVHCVQLLPKPRRYHLVVSFNAWCFHFPPSKYIDFVKGHLNGEATLILDVRKAQSGWRAELETAFGPAEMIAEGKKFERLVFHAD